MQWIGEGVLKLNDGSVVEQGEVIPEDQISPDVVKRLIKNGEIGDVPRPKKRKADK